MSSQLHSPSMSPPPFQNSRKEWKVWMDRTFFFILICEEPKFQKNPSNFVQLIFCPFILCLSVCLEKPWFASRMISEPGNLNYLYQALTKMAIVKKSEMISQWQWKQCNCKEDVKMPGLAMLICCVEMGQAFLISGCSIRPLLESQDRLNLCHQTICRGH